MSESKYFVEELKKPLTLLTHLALVPFIVLMILVLFTSNNESVVDSFRYLAAAIACFMAGTLWGFALLFKPENESFEFHRAGSFWGAVLVVLASGAVLLLQAKVGIFVAALLFLVLWQIENKTNLARLYPEWYWVLRTKATMVVAMCHILIWMTQG